MIHTFSDMHGNQQSKGVYFPVPVWHWRVFISLAYVCYDCNCLSNSCHQLLNPLTLEIRCHAGRALSWHLPVKWGGEPIFGTGVTIESGLRCLQHKYFPHLPE